MAKRPAPGGRPSKGARGHLLTRPPLALADAVRAEAERLHLSYSDYIANVLAQAHGFPPVIAPPQVDSQMKMIA